MQIAEVELVIREGYTKRAMLFLILSESDSDAYFGGSYQKTSDQLVGSVGNSQSFVLCKGSRIFTFGLSWAYSLDKIDIIMKSWSPL